MWREWFGMWKFEWCENKIQKTLVCLSSFGLRFGIEFLAVSIGPSRHAYSKILLCTRKGPAHSTGVIAFTTHIPGFQRIVAKFTRSNDDDLAQRRRFTRRKLRKSNARHWQFRVIRCTHHRVSIPHAFLTPERWQSTPGKPWQSNNGNCGPYRGPLHIGIENINTRHKRLRQSLTARRNSSPKQLRPRPGGFRKTRQTSQKFL